MITKIAFSMKWTSCKGSDQAIRRGGVFLTPLPFAKKALELLDRSLGNSWLQSGSYRLWDMAVGTGHLEHFLPKETLQYCYLSTLEQNDVQLLQKTYPTATVFQYDYLNDDTNKMPDALRKDLNDPQIKWVILVNPPYATAQEAGLKGRSKEGVADTAIRKQMHAENLGEVSRELYVQFLYRIVHEFQDRNALLGLFAPLKYLISTNYQKFRDNIFHADFQSGFIFSSENFGGTSQAKHFPVSFILWQLKNSLCPLCLCGQKRLTTKTQRGHKNTEPQSISLNILDSATQKIGTKTVRQVNRNEFLSRWIKRPRGTTVFPPFGSALTIKTNNVDTRNRIAEGFLASLMCPGNELQNQQQTVFLSGPQASAGALSVTPENFDQAVIVFAARRIPKDIWFTHVDQLMRPNRNPSPQFVSDCAVWSLFDVKNQTVSLRNVQYQDRTYQIANHFFPFCISDVKRWTISDAVIESSLIGAKNSFVADWLNRQTLSAESQAVLERAEEIYRYFFAHLHELNLIEFSIETYDAGWYQLRKALEKNGLAADLLDELKRRHKELRAIILPLLEDYSIVATLL